MAAFTKADALQLVDGATGTTKLALGDEQLSTILKIVNRQSLLSKYGASLPTLAINEGSITVNKSILTDNGEEKTALGAGTLSTEQRYSQHTSYLSKPRTWKGGFWQADLLQGYEGAVADKFTDAIGFVEKYREGRGLQNVVNKQAATVLPAKAGTVYTLDELIAVKNVLIDAAISIEQLEDLAEGIDGVEVSKIFIDLSPQLFNELADSRLLQDVAKLTFEEGAFSVAKMGGFMVRRNPNLRAAGTYKTEDSANKFVEAVVATEYSAISLLKMIAANAGAVGDLSNDEGYYVEARFTGDATGSPIGVDKPYGEKLIKVFTRDAS